MKSRSGYEPLCCSEGLEIVRAELKSFRSRFSTVHSRSLRMEVAAVLSDYSAERSFAHSAARPPRIRYAEAFGMTRQEIAP